MVQKALQRFSNHSSKFRMRSASHSYDEPMSVKKGINEEKKPPFLFVQNLSSSDSSSSVSNTDTAWLSRP